MQVVISPQARALIEGRGRCLFIWVVDHACCTGRLALLEASTEQPADTSSCRLVEVDGITVFIQGMDHMVPEEIQVEAGGLRRQRLRAYWDHCEFALF
ncbi:MAG: hypothetical protein ACRDZQ_01035 [Acidimicrobiales bacterium]